MLIGQQKKIYLDPRIYDHFISGFMLQLDKYKHKQQASSYSDEEKQDHAKGFNTSSYPEDALHAGAQQFLLGSLAECLSFIESHEDVIEGINAMCQRIVTQAVKDGVSDDVLNRVMDWFAVEYVSRQTSKDQYDFDAKAVSELLQNVLEAQSLTKDSLAGSMAGMSIQQMNEMSRMTDRVVEELKGVIEDAFSGYIELMNAQMPEVEGRHNN